MPEITRGINPGTRLEVSTEITYGIPSGIPVRDRSVTPRLIPPGFLNGILPEISTGITPSIASVIPVEDFRGFSNFVMWVRFRCHKKKNVPILSAKNASGADKMEFSP